MKVGDLVKRKPKWGAWVKHNPWMLSEEDLEVGIIIKRAQGYGKKEQLEIFCVLFNNDCGWHGKSDLVVFNAAG